jgi:hypothetical protein
MERRTGSDIPGWDRAEGLLRDLGANDVVIESVNTCVNDVEVQGRLAKFQRFAQDNPMVVLGALSALVAAGGTAVVAARRSTKKKAAASSSRKRTARSSKKRTLIEPHPGDKRYVRRDARGRIKESVDVGRSLAADRRRKSKTRAKAGAGDKGDR